MNTASTSAHVVREALAPYINLRQLRRMAATDRSLFAATLTGREPPAEVTALLDLLAALLTPQPREQISSPADLAALLMLDMCGLVQEQLRVICLDTKNHVQTITTLYQGSINQSCVRIAEVFREPIRRGSAAIIVAHNHPSGDPAPSPEDVAITRQLAEAGKLRDIAVLDDLVIGQGHWISLRERRLGFAG